ncbi:MAG: META domain-containing protein [Sphingomonas sp.]|uniref:META domain-containing protein n=1 Tax=Sphingomonas sp. TaxID=28214 RepID=UPI001B0EADFF|nr:META domain-containing protein [Sphingomonas sp.]MBO9623568.1 META domain-containing protein [Sphingomonas sp.]
MSPTTGAARARRIRAFVMSGLALAAAACATTGERYAEASTEPRLTGTEWRLVEFVSPKDAIGTIRPRAEEVYTIRLDPDGTLVAQLYCNRGTGSWTSPDIDKTMGSVSLNLKAVTMAACLPSPLERVSRDLANVRTFVIRDGRLHLNLMMDGGDYVWTPQ